MAYRFHDLRHFFVSVQIALGVPEMYIVRAVGHADGTMIRRVYGHIMATKQAEIDTRMESFIAQQFAQTLEN